MPDSIITRGFEAKIFGAKRGLLFLKQDSDVRRFVAGGNYVALAVAVDVGNGYFRVEAGPVRRPRGMRVSAALVTKQDNQ